MRKNYPIKLNSPFSNREKDVLNLLLLGKRNKTIAYELNISEHTVKVHLRRLFAKTGVSNRIALVISVMKKEQKEQTNVNHKSL